MERLAYKQQAEVRINEFVRSVYNWMCMGLAVTGLVAWYVSGSDAIFNVVIGNRVIFWILIIAELGLVMAISGAINRLSGTSATGLFLLFAAPCA